MGELTTLKDRIAKMTNNIDTLTTLVHNATLEEKAKKEESLHAGSKRKKTEDAVTDTSTCDMEVDAVTSADVYPLTDNSDMSNITFTPSNIFPSGPLLRSTSETSNISDAAFVDELFNALDSNDLPDPMACDIVPEVINSSAIKSEDEVHVTPPETPIKSDPDVSSCQQDPNAPDPKLMNKLSDALTVLPKDMQELLVNRLIATITSSEALKTHLDSISESSSSSSNNNNEMVTSETKNKKTMLPSGPALDNNPDVALPLAAATLTALMTHFSATIKNKSCVPNSKSLPVIPIHA